MTVAATEVSQLLDPTPGDFFQFSDLRVSSEGVVLAGKKLADLSEIVTRIPRTDVVQVLRIRPATGGFFGLFKKTPPLLLVYQAP